MQPVLFDELLNKAQGYFQKKNTSMRDAISPHEKLCVTLRFLASGSSYKDLAYSFRISVSAISRFVPETCKVIYNILKEQYRKTPSQCSDWIKLAMEFDKKWQFPHCVGSIDGKHIAIKAPPNAVSEYFNYKKHSSIILLGIADANAKFISFDIWAPGSMSDGGVFKNGFLEKVCKSDIFPSPCKLGLRPTEIPYFLLGDEAFALDQNLMKPYPHRSANGDEKVFNYRLSRARRIIENAFGILCARFRVLLKILELDVINVIEVVRACIALHNFLLTKKDTHYAPTGFMDTEDEDGQVVLGAWRDEVNIDTNNGNSHPSTRPSTVQARVICDDLKDYFFEEGEVPFQWKMTE